jgi:hypothetical protein
MRPTALARGARIFIFCTAVFLVCSPVMRAQGSLIWEDIAGSPGYDLIVRGSGDTLFATNARGVVYMSTDAGFTWSGILAYSSHIPITNVAASGSHLFVSIDDIDHPGSRYKILQWDGQPNLWHTIWATRDPGYSNIAVDPSGLLYLFSFGSLEVYNGSKWVVRSNALPFETATFSQNGGVTLIRSLPFMDDRENFIVGASNADGVDLNGLFISLDTGLTWRQPLSDFAVTAIDGSLAGGLLVGASPSSTVNTTGGVFISHDSGATWRGLGLSNHRIAAIARNDQGTIFAVADGAVYRYNDALSLWSQQTHATQPFFYLGSLSANNLIASSEGAGMFRSTNGGTGWAGGEIRGKDVFTLVLTDSGEIVAGTLGSGIFRSIFGGGSWIRSSIATGSSNIFSLCRNSGDGVLFAGTEDGVLHSTDRGISWQGSDDSSIVGSAFAVGALSNGTILAGTEFGVARSTDGGRRWYPSGIASVKVLFLDVSPADLVLAGTADDGVFLSNDGGTSWMNLGVVRDDIQTVLTAASGEFLVGVYGGVFRSTDMGASWNYIQFDRSYVYSLVKTPTGGVYAGTANGVFASFDDGATWSPAGNSGLLTRVILSLGVTADSKLLAGIYRTGIFRTTTPVAMTRTDDAGLSPVMPETYSLEQNYPNPFNPSTVIRYSLPHRSNIDLAVYDLTGRRVATVARGEQPAGTYFARWDASAVASGVYFYRLTAGAYRSVRKMVLIR